MMEKMMQQTINRMMGQLQFNPLFQRAQQMANGKSEQEIIQTVKNLCSQRGLDFDKAYQQFSSTMQNMQNMQNMNNLR